jgi:hypothetical protein
LKVEGKRQKAKGKRQKAKLSPFAFCLLLFALPSQVDGHSPEVDIVAEYETGESP